MNSVCFRNNANNTFVWNGLILHSPSYDESLEMEIMENHLKQIRQITRIKPIAHGQLV